MYLIELPQSIQNLIITKIQMRLILRNHNYYRVWNVKDYIQQIQSNIVAQDNQQYIAIQNIFNKLYLRHLNDHKQTAKHKIRLNNYVLASQAPATAIADYFHRKSRTYSESFLRITLQSLAQGYQISKIDNNGTLDTTGYRLFLSSQFQNISEQFKYGLKHNKISFQNLINMLQSFLKLQYLDYQIINLLLLYTKRQIQSTDQFQPLTNWPGDRQYQIQKHSYYNPKESSLLQGFKNNQELSTAISFIRHIHRQWLEQQKERVHIQEQNIGELNRLIDEMTQTNNNFKKLIEGILNIRRQYFKMVTFSQNQLILRNPNINIQLLQLQQKLMNVKLLNISDLKNPQTINDPTSQLKRIQEILLLILKIDKLDPLLTFIDKSNHQIKLQQQNQAPQPYRIASLFNLLSRFAALDRHLYHSADGRSLINIKWEKTLIQQTSKMSVGSLQEEELNVARIFRRVYGEVLCFFEENIDKVDKIFKRSLFTQKLSLAQSYQKIGLNQLSIATFNQLNQPQSIISQLTLEQFTKLLSVMNNIGIFIQNSTQLKTNIFQRLSKLIWQQQNNVIGLGLRVSIDSVNYLIQNHRNQESYQQLYERALDVLESKVLYYTTVIKENQVLVDAVRILAVQRPQKFISHPVYLTYLREMTMDNYKRNAYHSILREAGHKWAGKTGQINKLQPFLPLGFNNGILNGIYFSNSQQTSLDGTLRSGDLNAQIIRFQLTHKIKLNELSTNSFLQFDYSSKNNLFKLDKLQPLKSRLQQIYSSNQPQKYQQMFQDLSSKLQQTLSLYHLQSDLIANKIIFKLTILNKLINHDQNNQNVTLQTQYRSKVQFLLELFELNKLVELLDQKVTGRNIVKIIDQGISINSSLLGNSNQGHSDYFNKGQNGRFNEVEVEVESKGNLRRMIAGLIDQMANYINREQIKSIFNKTSEQSGQGYLQGDRQTIELLNPTAPSPSPTTTTTTTSPTTDNTAYFLNKTYYNDKSYCEYLDWKSSISKKYHIIELPYDKLSNISKILASKFCGLGHIKNHINLMPLCKHQNRYKRLNMEFKLLEDRQVKQGQILNNNKEQIVLKQKQLEYIINLQNFKHQLKTQFSEPQLLNYLFNFTFINDLTSPNPKSISTQNRSELFLPRNPQQYFQYLQHLNNQLYLQSPYAKYILTKISSTTHIKQLLDQRKQLRIALKIKYQQGKINGKQYFKSIDDFQQKILQSVQNLKTKLLDHTSNNLIQNQFKMIRIKRQEIQHFQQLLHKQIRYNRYFDDDFIMANGNYSKAMEYRRGRVQGNYVKFYILKKIMENRQLNMKQKEWVKNWHKDVVRSINNFVGVEKYTMMQISELAWQDLNKLQLKNTSLKLNRDMLLIDLLLEFNHFLDQELINSYESQIKAQYLANQYHIPHQLFQKTNSFAFKKIDVEVETAIKQEKSTFSEAEVDRVIELFKIYKVEGFKERSRYDDVCRRVRESILSMNKQSIRNELMEEYLKELDEQFFSDYNGNLIEEVKQKEMDKLWRQIFKQKYDNCKTIPLKQAVGKIILRLQIIGKNPPPFFGNLLIHLLKHPNLDSITKQSLVAAIELYKFDLNLDSNDIQKLSFIQPNIMPQSSTIKLQLEQFATVNVARLLKEKMDKALL